MEASPKRRCFLTRKTIPSGMPSSKRNAIRSLTRTIAYLLKLKSRSYPDVDGAYLTPNSSGPGSSVYLTLHHKAVDALHHPGISAPTLLPIQDPGSLSDSSEGAHLGTLHSLRVEVPSKLDGWVRYILAQAVLDELQLLAKRLRVHTPRVRNRSATSRLNESSIIALLSESDTSRSEQADGDRLIVNLPDGLEDGQSPNAPTNRTGVDEVDLRDFPETLRLDLLQCIRDLLSVERKNTIRSELALGHPLSSDELHGLVGKAPEHITAGAAGLSGRRISFTSSSVSQRSALATPAMIALLRWRLYSGAGWVTDV